MLAAIYKDLIVEESDRKPRLNLINRDGTVALHEVSVELASQVVQQGDQWGAREANLLLRIGDDGVPVPQIEGYDSSTATDAKIAAAAAQKADKNHSHTAAQLGAGTLPAGVVAATAEDYATSRLRNARFGTAAPGSLSNGEIYFVYE